MNKLKLLIAVPLIAGAVSACTSTGGYNSPEYRLPDGSTVELTRTLKFPYQSVRAYVQGGEVLPWSDINKYVPYCSFGLNRNRIDGPLAREIPPTRFVTGEFRIGVDARLEPATPVQLAGNAPMAGVLLASEGAMSGGGGTPWPYTYYTTIELYSEDAPQVDDLTCAFLGGTRDENLTLDEIRGTLGDLVRIY